MVTLARGTIHFLRLNRSRDNKARYLDFFQQFDQTLNGWTIGTRLSPIFGIRQSPPPKLSRHRRSWVFFCGPLYPGDIDPSFDFTVYLNHGLFNIIFYCISKAQRTAARKFIKAKSVFWEEWTLKGNQIISSDFGGPKKDEVFIPPSILSPIGHNPPDLEMDSREYVTQVASAVSRALLYLPDSAKELIAFDTVCRKFLKRKDFGRSTKQDILVNTNAALSLHVSQTYSGISPIFETKNRLWNHSLLGIGTSSLALAKIRSFLERALDNAKLVQRILALQNIKSISLSIVDVPPENAFWNTDHLRQDESILAEFDEVRKKETFFPPVTFFSGRDGYRATHFTLSAPLEIVSSCNTATWTLLTMTHEISHSVVSMLLGALLPRPAGSEDRFSPAIQSMKLPNQGDNLFEQVRSLLCFGVWRMATEDFGKEGIDPSSLKAYFDSHWRELNEILTSCFDFMYFYRSNPEKYVRFLWISWESIPNIQDRIPEYVIRILCALHTANVRRESGRITTLDQFIDILSKTISDFPSVNYAKRALTYVSEKRSECLDELKSRELLVKFAKHFLFSRDAAAIIMRADEYTGRGRRKHPDIHSFTGKPLTSPLRFIEEVAQDNRPDMMKSFAILQHLAFNKI